MSWVVEPEVLSGKQWGQYRLCNGCAPHQWPGYAVVTCLVLIRVPGSNARRRAARGLPPFGWDLVSGSGDRGREGGRVGRGGVDRSRHDCDLGGGLPGLPREVGVGFAPGMEIATRMGGVPIRVLSYLHDPTDPTLMAGADKAWASWPEAPESAIGTFDGDGLIAKLAQLQTPGSHERLKFDQINAFVAYVLDDQGAQLNILYDQSQILVRTSGVLRPLASLGTGVHQVIILASAATVLDEHLICSRNQRYTCTPCYNAGYCAT